MKPPNVTFTDSMAIHKGGREVQLLFLGRGHTGGDTMVFLPAERIVFTGDFFEGRPGGGVLSYLGDSFIDEGRRASNGSRPSTSTLSCRGTARR